MSRKDFETYALNNLGPDFHDFTPWGEATGHVLPESEFQYIDHGVNRIWLAYQSRDTELNQLRDELEQVKKDNVWLEGRYRRLYV